MIKATPCGNDPILYARVYSFMTCKNLTSNYLFIYTKKLLYHLWYKLVLLYLINLFFSPTVEASF
jgi:hypothetical protein